MQMDRQYIEEHRRTLFTMESFGAQIADYALRQAMEQVGDGTADSVEVPIVLHVRPQTLRRTLSKDQAARLGDTSTERPIGSINLDCISVGVPLGPVVVGVHIAI